MSHLYPNFQSSHGWKIPYTAEAYITWSRWASLLDVERFPSPPGSAVIMLFNHSLQQQSMPWIWKLAKVTPIPKESPYLTSCNQLWPISLTNIITRIFEKLQVRFEISEAFKSLIRPDQFAYRQSLNTTMVLLKSQHNWLKWLDNDADFVWV